ncbi:MAG: hypothetical protein Ta2D_12010 [Rickettsiales bacterium]|nr:MAG: hypothetical protein Ta2D_12010 [Rickettsiales bacterium]
MIKRLKLFLFFYCLTATFSFANFVDIDFTLNGACDTGSCTFNLNLDNIDALRGGDVNAIFEIQKQIAEQGISQGFLTQDEYDGWSNDGKFDGSLPSSIASLTETDASSLQGVELGLTIAGERVEIVIAADGGITIPVDNLGIFNGMCDITSCNINNFDDFINGDFATKFKEHIETLIDGGELYAILSKTFVKEVKRKIADTPDSVIGGNPLSVMYSLADTDFYLAINDKKVDSYSYPQVYYAEFRDAKILSARLPLNFYSNLFGMLEPMNLSLRFEMPITFTQIEKPDSKIVGGSFGLGMGVRLILPETITENWSLTLSYRPLVISAAYNDKLKDMNEDDIMALSDLSLLQDAALLNSIGFTSKKTFQAAEFNIDEEKLNFELINSITIVTGYDRKKSLSLINSVNSVMNSLGKKNVEIEDKYKNAIPNFDIENKFFKNGIGANYTPYQHLTINGMFVYTMVFGKTKVYVPNYYTLAFSVIGNIDLWVFENPAFGINISRGANSWNSMGANLRLEF